MVTVGVNGIRVLLVDDEALVRAGLRLILEGSGGITGCATGSLAIWKVFQVFQAITTMPARTSRPPPRRIR